MYLAIFPPAFFLVLALGGMVENKLEGEEFKPSLQSYLYRSK